MFNKKEYNKQWAKDNRERMNKWSREWRKNNPEKYKKYNKQRYEERKQYIDDYKLSKGCSVCGYNKYAEALDFHHIEDNKEFTIGRSRSTNMKSEKLKKEMDKCDVLCCRCHRELHVKERENV